MGIFVRSWRCCRHYTRRALLARWIGGQILLGRLWWRSSRAPRVRWSWTEIYIDHVDRHHCNCQSQRWTCDLSLQPECPTQEEYSRLFVAANKHLGLIFFQLETFQVQVEGIRNHWKMHPSARRLDDVDAILKFAQLLREYEDQGALVWMRRASRKGHPLATWTLCSDSPSWPDDEKTWCRWSSAPLFFAKLI